MFFGVDGLKADLKVKAPVGNPILWKSPYAVTWAKKHGYVGGSFKKAWSIKKINPMHFQISNRMKYADALWGGWSKQWSAGGTPMLEKTNNRMHRRFKEIKA